MAVIQLGEIFPVHPPCPGNLNLTLWAPHQPLGMGFVKICGPAGMIDGDIDKYPGIAPVHGVHQFDELLQGGSVMIKFGQGWINRGKAQRGIGAAKSSHAAIGGGGGMNRQQHQNSAAKLAQDKIQFAHQVPEGPRWRNHTISALVEPGDEILIQVGQEFNTGLVGTELAYERIVNNVGTAIVGRINVQDGIGARGPDRSRLVPGQEETFGFKVPAFKQRQGCRKRLPVDAGHGNIKPGPAQGGFILFNLVDNFPADDMGLSDIGADPGSTVMGAGQCQFENDLVATKFHQSVSRRRFLNQLFIDAHSEGGKLRIYLYQ